MRKVIVLGGGFAGSLLTKKLERKFNVTLVDEKDYFEFTPSVLRAIVGRPELCKIRVCHKGYLKKTRLVNSRVKEVRESEVVLSNGKKIKFDYLAVCLGSRYANPIKDRFTVSASRGKEIAEFHKHIDTSNRIGIVGGGLAGVELAGEFIDFYPNKEIIIFNSSNELISRNSKKARIYAKNFLEKKGVRIIWDSWVTGKKGKKIKLRNGRTEECDFVFFCTGIIPNSEPFKKNFKNLINNKGFLRVNEHQQLDGIHNILACGDITNNVEEKTAQNAIRQAKIVYKNIINLEKRKKLREYHSKKTSIVISLGRFNGILDTDNFTIVGIIPALIKKTVEKWNMFRIRWL